LPLLAVGFESHEALTYAYARFSPARARRWSPV
jgi:hypothetical protein